ncbi:MAG: helix-turn-helix domain-containing protein, partial [Rhizobiales bacterium]|nr:helix-turn-helix domain-containing protein [Hyphomicrobiales bacterium]
MMDKRDLGEMFRTRLVELVAQYKGSQAEFAREIGIDRSALSQLLSSNISRLPRAETLRNLAETQQVSLDWLLGLSNSEARSTQIEHTTAIEGVFEQENGSRLAQWHADAAGYKIRYVPAWIPDLLSTPETIALFSGNRPGLLISDKLQGSHELLSYTRKPETDMEACMPVQRLISLYRGEGIWAELSEEQRAEQLDRMERLTRELYPTFRLFLYDQ